LPEYLWNVINRQYFSNRENIRMLAAYVQAACISKAVEGEKKPF
jgi:hypothetical protein